MRVKQYGHIKPKEIKCTGCGAELEYCKPDIKKRYTHNRYYRDEIEEYVNCPVCGRGVVITNEYDEDEEEE